MSKLYDEIIKDLVEIISLVESIKDDDWDIDDVLANIEDIQNKYQELSEENTQVYENKLP